MIFTCLFIYLKGFYLFGCFDLFNTNKIFETFIKMTNIIITLQYTKTITELTNNYANYDFHRIFYFIQHFLGKKLQLFHTLKLNT